MNEIKENHPKIPMFPRPFRLAGLLVFLMAVIFLVGYKTSGQEFIPKETARAIFEAFLIVGLVFISYGKRKNEDERTIHFRFQAAASTILFIALYLTFLSFTRTYYTVRFTIIFMLLVYWSMTEILIYRDR